MEMGEKVVDYKQVKKDARKDTYTKIAENYGVPVEEVANTLDKPPSHEDFWKWLAPALDEIRAYYYSSNE